MNLQVLLFFVMALCVETQSAPWAQCCDAEDGVLRCTEELARHRDCTTVLLPNRRFRLVTLCRFNRNVVTTEKTWVDVMAVANEQQFNMICDKQIHQIQFEGRIKSCNVKSNTTGLGLNYEVSTKHNLTGTGRDVILKENDSDKTTRSNSISEIHSNLYNEHLSTSDTELTTDVHYFNFSVIIDSTSPSDTTTTSFSAQSSYTIPSSSALPSITTNFFPDKMTIIIVVPVSMATLVSVLIVVCRYFWRRRRTNPPQLEAVVPAQLDQPVRPTQAPVRPSQPNHPIRQSQPNRPIRPAQPTRPVFSSQSPRLNRPTQPESSPNPSTASFHSARSSSSDCSDTNYWLRRVSRINYRE